MEVSVKLRQSYDRQVKNNLKKMKNKINEIK